jgi:DNA invertase Pin-like site-specific DNA recombinase
MSASSGSVAAYLRISIDRGGEQISTERQSRQAKALAKKHRLPPPIDYVEPGSTSASGTRGATSAYRRLLADVNAGKVTTVIVWDIDRFLRRPDELEDWLKLCEGRGIRIVTMDGEVDTDTPNGRLFLRIKVSVARHEVEHKAARQKFAHRDRAENGKPFLGSRRTFGFTETFEPVPAETTMVRQAFDDVVAGTSLRAIVRRWNADGLVSTRGNPWTTTALRVLLSNPTYAARRRYLGVVVADLDGVEAVVDRDTFDTVQAILRNPERLTSDRGGRGPLHLLSGATCGVCTARLSYGRSTPRPGGVSYSVIRCRDCLKIARKAAPIEQYVADVVVERLRRKDAARLFRVIAPDLRPLQARAAALRAQRDELASDLTVDLAFAVARDRRLRAELDAVEDEITAKSGTTALAAFAGGADPAEIWASMDLDARRAVHRELFDVVVLPVGRQGRVAFDPDTVRIDWLR